jgi:hypothetical protein
MRVHTLVPSLISSSHSEYLNGDKVILDSSDGRNSAQIKCTADKYTMLKFKKQVLHFYCKKAMVVCL